MTRDGEAAPACRCVLRQGDGQRRRRRRQAELRENRLQAAQRNPRGHPRGRGFLPHRRARSAPNVELRRVRARPLRRRGLPCMTPLIESTAGMPPRDDAMNSPSPHVTPLVALVAGILILIDAAAAELHRRDLPDHCTGSLGLNAHPPFHRTIWTAVAADVPACVGGACGVVISERRAQSNSVVPWPDRRRSRAEIKAEIRPARAQPRRSRARKAPAEACQRTRPRARRQPRRRQGANGSTPSATARPRASRRCATCSAARARASPRWPISACRCRPASPSPPRSAPTTTPTATRYPKDLEAPGRRRARRRSAASPARPSAIPANPLLVSVRSGARASMPGMMDTVLNLGLNDETVEALAKKSGDRRFAYDSYRRFITMYSDVVLGIEPPPLRGNPRRPQGPQRLRARHRSHRRRLGRTGRPLQGARRGGARRAVPAGPARSSCGARSARCSARG